MCKMLCVCIYCVHCEILCNACFEQLVFVNFKVSICNHVVPVLHHLLDELKYSRLQGETGGRQSLQQEQPPQPDRLDAVIARMQLAKSHAQETLHALQSSQREVNDAIAELDRMNHNLRLSSRLVRSIFSFSGIAQNLITAHPKKKVTLLPTGAEHSIVAKNVQFDEDNTFHVLLMDASGVCTFYVVVYAFCVWDDVCFLGTG